LVVWVRVPPNVWVPPDGWATTLAVTDTPAPGVDPVKRVTVGEIENCTPDSCGVLLVLRVAERPT
jgi:hypothetical protein